MRSDICGFTVNIIIMVSLSISTYLMRLHMGEDCIANRHAATSRLGSSGFVGPESQFIVGKARIMKNF